MIRICSLWSSENNQWASSNWTWNECELVQEICQKWNTTQRQWSKSPFRWSDCSTCRIWGETDVLWKNAKWRWSECSSSVTPPIPPIPPVVPIGNLPGVDATTLIQPWLEEPWNPYRTSSLDKHRRLIKLVCKVKGQKYEKEKEIKDFPVTVGDIRMIIKAVANIDLDFKLEE